MNKVIELVLCHLVGDLDFIAHTKGTNWYHLFVHCALYILPFYILFGLTWQLVATFTIHIIVDSLKARYKVISYATDQVLHYLTLLI